MKKKKVFFTYKFTRLSGFTYVFLDMFKLEDDWKEIVKGASDLSERLQQQQNVLWELIYTEVVYIHKLKVITDVSIIKMPPIKKSEI